MRLATAFFTVCFLSACAGSPPKPAQPEGEFRPINRPQATPTPSHTDGVKFVFDGDISEVLTALHSVSPTFSVLPPQGIPKPVNVRLNLLGVPIETVLKAIGAQGGNTAEVIYQSTKQGDANQVFIRYKGKK